MDLAQRIVAPPAAGDGRQVPRGRGEIGQGDLLAGHCIEGTAEGASLEGVFLGDDPLIIGKCGGEPDIGVGLGQDRPVPGRGEFVRLFVIIDTA